MPPLEGFDVDFDVGVEQVNDNPSDGPRERFVLYTDGALWDQVTKTKVLQSELLRWYLQLKKFDIVVHDKADPDQAWNKGQPHDLKRVLLGGNPSFLSLSFL